MTSEQAEPQKLLQAGIRAAKAGDRARARDLLLQVVDQNQTIELAWIWLSEVVDDLEDKVTALENALALNPANAAVDWKSVV